MPNRAVTDREVQRAAAQAGIPVSVLRAMLFRGERSGANAVSPTGAYGQAQLMPGTAKALEQRYPGLKTNTPYGNILGGAYYLAEQKKRFGSWRLAFAAYNAGPGAVEEYGGVPPYQETQDYVRRTMAGLTGKAGAKVPKVAKLPVPGAGGSGSPPLPAGLGFDPLEASAALGLQHLAQGDYDPRAALAELERLQSLPAASQTPSGVRGSTPPGAAPVVQTTKARRKPPKGGWLAIPPAQGEMPGPGPGIVSFATQLAQAYGRQLPVSDTTTHSRYTVNGRVSAHSVGRALDIPATGAKLRRLGYLALLQAGMDKRSARKAMRTGGLFNVGNYQVIFGTNEGGNHFNHVHIGIRG